MLVLSKMKPNYASETKKNRNTSFFFINVGVRVSLRAPRLIPRGLKLTTI